MIKSLNETYLKFMKDKQKITSKDTSINKNVYPAVFNRVKDWEEGTVNLDIGGGKYDTATDYLENFGVENLIYDPYNRDEEWNKDVE